jgi:hypothetical protein
MKRFPTEYCVRGACLNNHGRGLRDIANHKKLILQLKTPCQAIKKLAWSWNCSLKENGDEFTVTLSQLKWLLDMKPSKQCSH